MCRLGLALRRLHIYWGQSSSQKLAEQSNMFPAIMRQFSRPWTKEKATLTCIQMCGCPIRKALPTNTSRMPALLLYPPTHMPATKGTVSQNNLPKNLTLPILQISAVPKLRQQWTVTVMEKAKCGSVHLVGPLRM